MKKALILLIIVTGLLFVSCMSMAPVHGDNGFPTGSNYKILGRVTTTSSSTKSGYKKLLATAQKEYPECDDIINIIVDKKVTVFLCFVFTSYKMSTIAVDYTDMQ